MFQRHRRTIAVVVALFCLQAVNAGAQAPTVSPEMLSDAELTDIAFVDPDRGFAVGDRGALWKTEDGGRHWRLIPAPVACRWESIHFVDREHGWIVGGNPHQLTHQTSGEILRTRDGGRTWVQVPKLTISALKQVKFFDAKQGIAIGQASEFSPSGMYRTGDGGLSWTPITGASQVGWNCAAFLTPARGVVGGPRGSVSLMAGQELLPVRMPNISARAVRRLALADDRHAWLIGDGGLVLASDSAGSGWTMPPGEIPAIARQQMDLRALAVHGPHCWIAGAPGSVVLHTHDGGATWELSKTGHAAPLRSLYFLDEHRGWAVGALGTILATRDGGRTWTEQRSGGSRAALLGLFSRPDRIPLEVITHAAGNDGYLTAVEILNTDIAEPRHGRMPIEERTAAALAQIGGSAVDHEWRFPVRERELRLPPEAIVQLWDQVNDGRSVEELEAVLVRKIRQWRPEVIMTERASPRGAEPLSHIINQIVLNAVTKAADPGAYVEQREQLGLEAWKPKKVFSTLPPETPGMVNLSTAQLAPRLGASLADATTTSRGLVLEAFQPPPQQLGLQLVMSTLSREISSRDLFSGIHLAAGSDARRTLNDASPTSLEALKRQAQRARTVQQLMARGANDRASGSSWLGQVNDLTQGLSRASAAQTLYELAWRYQRSGQWDAAAEAYQVVVDRYGEEEIADAAALWLVQFYASSEASARLRGGAQMLWGNNGDTAGKSEVVTASAVQPVTDQPNLNVRASLMTSATGLSAPQRQQRAIELANRLASSRPRLAARPELRFPLAAAQRQNSLLRQAEGIYRGFTNERVHDGWWACASAEIWMQQPTLEAPKPMATCARTTEKPHLDGLLDDEVWKNAKPLELSGRASEPALPGATALLAHDGEFLYLAITCQKLPGFDYSLTDETRGRDSDLSLNDRIDLCLDRDRDYCTYHRLSVDYRGFTHDASLGDATWNPTWYVAAEQDATTWTIEAAIPLSELYIQPPQARDVWAVGLSRLLPGAGLASWNKPASAQGTPEGFGLLTFE